MNFINKYINIINNNSLLLYIDKIPKLFYRDPSKSNKLVNIYFGMYLKYLLRQNIFSTTHNKSIIIKNNNAEFVQEIFQSKLTKNNILYRFNKKYNKNICNYGSNMDYHSKQLINLGFINHSILSTYQVIQDINKQKKDYAFYLLRKINNKPLNKLKGININESDSLSLVISQTLLIE